MIGIIAVFFLIPANKLVRPLYLTENYVTVDHWGKLVFYYVIVTLLALMPLFLGKRASCHYLCPMSMLNILGTKMKNKLSIPSLRLTAKPEKCILCGECCNACGSGVLKRRFGS